MGWLASAIDSESNTKRCLWKTLRNANLNYDESHTVLVEVAGTLNSRPLTYVSSDDDPEEPLTPRHLMCGRRILSLPEVIGNRQASIVHTVSSEDLPRSTWDCYWNTFGGAGAETMLQS